MPTRGSQNIAQTLSLELKQLHVVSGMGGFTESLPPVVAILPSPFLYGGS